MCQDEWFAMYGTRAIDHFGRTTEPMIVDCDSGWYKDYKYNYTQGNDTHCDHYFVNDLLGQRIPITQQQYDNQDLITPINT